MITRADGYRRSAGKEEKGILVAVNFLSHVLGVNVELISDKHANYSQGDLLTENRKSIEVKTQPINPIKFKYNFVELFEITDKPEHSAGFRRVADILEMTLEKLASVAVRLRNGQIESLTHLANVSVSIESFNRSIFVVYVNPYDANKYIYVYEKSFLKHHITDAVLKKGLVRGAGNSNVDTFAVYVPYPPAIWRHTDVTGWKYAGSEREHDVMRSLTECLFKEDASYNL